MGHHPHDIKIVVIFPSSICAKCLHQIEKILEKNVFLNNFAIFGKI
jgi:hypothetical protein